MVKESQGAMSAVNFKLGSPNVRLKCIESTADYGIRSAVECALWNSAMDYYENSFVYRNGKCHVCRTENMNCAALQTEMELVGPHYFRGKLIIYTDKAVI